MNRTMNQNEIDVDENIQALSEEATSENVQLLKFKLSAAWLNNETMLRTLSESHERLLKMERRIADLETALRVVLSLS